MRSLSFSVRDMRPSSIIRTPAVSGRSNFESFRSRLCTISAMARTPLSGRPTRPHQRLERAAVFFVSEVAADHVEADFASARGAFSSAKRNRAFGIDEAADEPGRGHAVDLDARAGDPGLAAQFGIRFEHPCLLLAIAFQTALDRRQRFLRRRAALGLEEIDAADFFETAGEARVGRGELGCRRGAAGRFHPGVRVCGDGRVIGVAGLAKLGDGRVVGHAVDEVTMKQMGVAAAGDDLLRDPLQVFQRVGAVRQKVDRVLHRDRTNVREALADLGPEVQRAGRDAMNQDEPARHCVSVATAVMI